MTQKMNVVLVDEQDQVLGQMEKMEAHQKALLHRAFSVFIFNEKGEMLLQQRSVKKYHSGGLWTNACCSHPQFGENIIASARKRLQEEMGFSTELQFAFSFVYKEPVEHGLTEFEFDHVLVGSYSGTIEPHEDEVSEYCYKTMKDIEWSIHTHPEKYTVWFRIAFPKLQNFLSAS